MHINMSHDVMRNQNAARRLDIQVRWFLRKKKLQQPHQIEFGRSLWLEHCEANSTNPYKFSLELRMQADIAEASKDKQTKTTQTKKQKVEPIYTPDESSDENRIAFNRSAREKAVHEGLKKFMGKCKKHGQQIFTVKKGGRDHLCLICQRKFSTVQNEKRKKQKQVAA